MTSAPVEIHLLADGDLREVCRTRVGPGAHEIEPVVLEQRLRCFAFDNPARLAEVPAGWVLRTPSGAIAGSMLCVPQRFEDPAGNTIPCAFWGYRIDPAYRSAGSTHHCAHTELADRHF